MSITIEALVARHAKLKAKFEADRASWLDRERVLTQALRGGALAWTRAEAGYISVLGELEAMIAELQGEAPAEVVGETGEENATPIRDPGASPGRRVRGGRRQRG